jgi:hypothetical protein
MPTIAEPDDLRDHPQVAYPRYQEARNQARRRAADPIEADGETQVYRYRGTTRRGAARCGVWSETLAGLAARVATLYRQGWRDLTVVRGDGPVPPRRDEEQTVAAIGRHDGERSRSWWSEGPAGGQPGDRTGRPQRHGADFPAPAGLTAPAPARSGPGSRARPRSAAARAGQPGPSARTKRTGPSC